MRSSLSLAGRAALAVMLMLGFYVLAIAIAGISRFIPYAEWTYAGSLHLKLALFCVLAAGNILWSILPRLDRFIPPGPALEPKEPPQLFETLSSIAQATKQEMPSQVYMIPDMNAWVAHRGGIIGFGGRRVMGLGLPLLQVLSVSQLRAVLAHEFGHFHGGDTKLGPWLYKTRAAIGRTLQGLAERSSLLQKPFLWYGKAFLRITHAVSRRQEFAADELAARLIGSRPLIEGLKLVRGAALAFNAYGSNEVVPVLNRGFHPPMAEGFRRYFASPQIAEAVSACVDRELTEGETDPYDTHPPLRERVAALQNWPEGAMPEHDPPAITLLNNIADSEIRLVGSIVNASTAYALKPLAWDEVGQKIWIPAWEAYTQQHSGGLAGITPRTIPEFSQDLDVLSQRLGVCDGEDLAPEERRRQASVLLGAALAVALNRRGWELRALPGDEVVCEHEGTLIIPFEIVPVLATGALTPVA